MKKYIALLLAMVLALTLVACDSRDYREAMDLLENGQYEKALEMFEELGDYEDSRQKCLECKLAIAEELMDAEKYAEALPFLEELEQANGLEDKLNTLGWCRLAAHLQENGEQKVGLASDTVTFKMTDGAIQLIITSSISVFRVDIRREETEAALSAAVVFQVGLAKIEQAALTTLDISTYKRGDEIDWEQSSRASTDYMGNATDTPLLLNGGTFGTALDKYAEALETLDLSVTLQDLGFKAITNEAE